MTKRMLIDATHAEETRVVVLDGNRLEDFDVETSAKKQLKGNIYLAKVVRVEPSLQAAFVEYGGGRHGFLAFGEIHPDYYQIPVADRQRLLAMQAEEARAEAEAEDAEALGGPPDRSSMAARTPSVSEPPFPSAADEPPAGDEPDLFAASEDAPPPTESEPDAASSTAETAREHTAAADAPMAEPEPSDRPAQAMTMARDERFGPADAEVSETPIESLDLDPSETTLEDPPPEAADERGLADLEIAAEPEPPPETIGGDPESSGADDARRRRESRFLRNYRIQEVIRRRQIMLIQVVKEERGTKGAALTTYISLAGRFSVLMPNSPRGGGISRKITSAADRRRLKEVTAELDLPQGMGLIVRTAGANRPKPEIKRDCEYLMRLWDEIRDLTMRSVAPALIYEEASLIKRAIRDGYSRDIEEVIVDGEAGWRAAHEFMRMLMPSHARKVQLWRGTDADGAGQPLFAKHQVEAQLDAMLTPTVQLKSGGYLVIDQTEALVAIDVNSGRSTRERGIEETAYRTNLEAADEAARQLRLRDLAGLIVIDFIDMESRKNNAAVERRLKDALREDRARIQVGSISHFGLLEMSRQRLRPSVTETSFVACPHCAGSGHVRSTESAAIHVLRGIEDEGARARSAVIMVHAAASVVMYLLNHKRDRLAEIEARTFMRVQFAMDETLVPPAHRIDRVRARSADDRPLIAAPLPVAPAFAPPLGVDEPEIDEDEAPEAMAAAPAPAPATPATATETAEEGERRRRRRRRRRGGRREGGEASGDSATASLDLAESDGDNLDTDEAEADIESASAEPEILPDHVGGVATEAPSLAPEHHPDVLAEIVPAAALTSPELTDEPPADLDGEAGGARRRGRRGGRRRRREDGAEPATADAVAAEAPVQSEFPVAAYTGPTPADPFGGTGFDIYDLLDTAPSEPVAPPPPPPRPSRRAAKAAPLVAAPVAAVVDVEPEPTIPLPSASEPEVAAANAVVEASPPAPESAVAPDAPAVPAPESEVSSPSPLVGSPQPVVVGDTQGGQPRRGWWRR